MATSKEGANPFEQGPYVQVAAFCERVLREADGVLSLIRVVDVVTHTERGPNPPRDMPEMRYPLNLVISLKPGRSRGRHDLTIIPEKPSGETLPSASMSVQMEGDARGVNVISTIDIPYSMEGLYWFRVNFDDQLLTRLPLQIRYSRLVSGSASQQA